MLVRGVLAIFFYKYDAEFDDDISDLLVDDKILNLTIIANLFNFMAI